MAKTVKIRTVKKYVSTNAAGVTVKTVRKNRLNMSALGLHVNVKEYERAIRAKQEPTPLIISEIVEALREDGLVISSTRGRPGFSNYQALYKGLERLSGNAKYVPGEGLIRHETYRGYAYTFDPEATISIMPVLMGAHHQNITKAKLVGRQAG